MSEQHTAREPWHDLEEMKNTLLNVKAGADLDGPDNDRLAWVIGGLNIRIEREKNAHGATKREVVLR